MQCCISALSLSLCLGLFIYVFQFKMDEGLCYSSVRHGSGRLPSFLDAPRARAAGWQWSLFGLYSCCGRHARSREAGADEQWCVSLPPARQLRAERGSFVDAEKPKEEPRRDSRQRRDPRPPPSRSLPGRASVSGPSVPRYPFPSFLCVVSEVPIPENIHRLGAGERKAAVPALPPPVRPSPDRCCPSLRSCLCRKNT